MYLTPNYGAASLFKMLTYPRVCCAFSSTRAMSLNVICIFEMACKNEKMDFSAFQRLEVLVHPNGNLRVWQWWSEHTAGKGESGSTKIRYKVSMARNYSFREKKQQHDSRLWDSTRNYIIYPQNYSYVNTELLRRKYGEEIGVLLMIWVGLVYSLSNFEAIRAKTNLLMQWKGGAKGPKRTRAHGFGAKNPNTTPTQLPRIRMTPEHQLSSCCNLGPLSLKRMFQTKVVCT